MACSLGGVITNTVQMSSNLQGGLCVCSNLQGGLCGGVNCNFSLSGYPVFEIRLADHPAFSRSPGVGDFRSPGAATNVVSVVSRLPNVTRPHGEMSFAGYPAGEISSTSSRSPGSGMRRVI